jgi:hypothetical protein
MQDYTCSSAFVGASPQDPLSTPQSGVKPVRVIYTKSQNSGFGSQDIGAPLNDALLTEVEDELFDTEILRDYEDLRTGAR